jgi:hypothetical protein
MTRPGRHVHGVPLMVLIPRLNPLLARPGRRALVTFERVAKTSRFRSALLPERLYRSVSRGVSRRSTPDTYG